MSVKEFKRQFLVDAECIKLVDSNGRFVGPAEHQSDWDDAEVKSWEVIKRERFPNFYIVII